MSTALLAAVALVAVGVAAVSVSARQQAQERTAAATAKVQALEARVEELEAAVGPEQAGGLGGLEGLLDELLGEGGLEGLDLEGLGDLLGGDGGGVQDLLDGLLGGDGLGGLGDALEGLGGLDSGAAADLAGCVDVGGGDGQTLADDVADALPTIIERVEAERGLAFEGEVDAAFLDAQELSTRVRDLTLEDYSEEAATVDARLLTTLGAVAPGTDLRQVFTDLLGDQVAGFYDPDTRELVVGSQGGTDAATQVFLAHELVHALTDEAIGLPELDDMDGEDDAALASLAMVEGDATLAMQRYATAHLSLQEQLGMAGGDASLDGVPVYLAEQLTFPYLEGLQWTCRQFRDGGWEAVDAAYADPPRTTLEILDPTAAGLSPEPVALPPAPTADWSLIDDRTLGAADLLFLFRAPGDQRSSALADPRGSALAWRGGRVLTWDREGRTAVGLSLAGAPTLCTSMNRWYAAAFPAATASEEQVASGSLTTYSGGLDEVAVRCDAGRVRLGFAPTADEARAITG